MTPATAARLVVVLGLAAVAVGVWRLLGPDVGLITAGLLTAVVGVLLIDVDTPRPPSDDNPER